MESHLYLSLTGALANTAITSVAHRAEHAHVHNRELRGEAVSDSRPSPLPERLAGAKSAAI